MSNSSNGERTPERPLMKHRIDLVVAVPRAKFKYEGTILGHYVLGEEFLPDTDYGPMVGEARLRGRLLKDSGLDMEAMEATTEIAFYRIESAGFYTDPRL